MSILAATDPSVADPTTVDPTLVDPTTVVTDPLIVAITLLGLILFFVTGCHRMRSIVGPMRLESTRSSVPTFYIFLLGTIIWLGSSSIIAQQVKHRLADSDATRPATLADFSPADVAIISLVPPLLGLATIVLGHALVHPAGARTLGFSLRQMPKGLLIGALGYLIVLPLIFWTGFLMQQVYRLIGYEHPMEHDLLRVMGESPSPMLRLVMIFSAVAIVPVFEELLFRGHFQSLVARAMGRGAPIAPVNPIAVPPPPPGSDPLDMPTPDASPNAPVALHDAQGVADDASHASTQPPAATAGAGSRWLAVLIISLIFSLFHPLWSVPVIFVLSVALGYAYERTGNLWVPIGIHAMFNGLSTLQYMLLLRMQDAGEYPMGLW